MAAVARPRLRARRPRRPLPGRARARAAVLYSRPDWDTQPHRVVVARGPLKAGSFPRDDTHMMMLRMSTRTDLRLLVVPPGHPTGDQAMRLAADPANRWSTTQILAAGAFDDEHGEDGDEPSTGPTRVAAGGRARKPVRRRSAEGLRTASPRTRARRGAPGRNGPRPAQPWRGAPGRTRRSSHLSAPARRRRVTSCGCTCASTAWVRSSRTCVLVVSELASNAVKHAGTRSRSTCAGTALPAAHGARQLARRWPSSGLPARRRPAGAGWRSWTG